MQRSIATVSLCGTLPDKLEAIAAAGFDGVEIFENDLLYHGGSPRDVRRRRIRSCWRRWWNCRCWRSLFWGWICPCPFSIRPPSPCTSGACST